MKKFLYRFFLVTHNIHEFIKKFLCMCKLSPMYTIPTIPNWAPGVAMRLVPLGIRTVVRKQNGAVYMYRYLRFDVRLFPEVVGAKRIRLVAAPPDLTAPPVIITARLFQKGKQIHGFIVDAVYQKIVSSYARNGHVGIIAVEVIEKEVKTSGAL